MADAAKMLNLTVDGKKITAPAGSLLIEACKSVGIEVPSFCYYPNLSLQGACRMCLVKIEKMPKLQTACTTVIGEGMVVTSDSDEIKQAKAWSSCCSATIHWIARFATPAANANCRT
jgi:NADH-quinone oxidoreductase subunit G